jgi:multiple sugar transport system permease protein
MGAPGPLRNLPPLQIDSATPKLVREPARRITLDGAPVRRIRRRRDGAAAAAFLLPSAIGLTIFLLVPLIASFALSLTDAHLIGTTHFIGLRNYATLLQLDPNFWGVFGNTLEYTAEYLILNIVLSLGLAVWIANLRWGRQFFRILFFLPTFTPLIGAAIVWLLILTPGGLLDWAAGALGLPLPNLLTNPNFALHAVVLVSLWSGFGYNLLLFSAALDSIPETYLDAASIDGASSWQQFWYIRLPLISPALFFGTVMTAITSLQVFDQIYALTRGGPGSATQTLGYYIYASGFERYRIGYASAVAWSLFIIILALTAIQLRLQRRWVNYDA